MSDRLFQLIHHSQQLSITPSRLASNQPVLQDGVRQLGLRPDLFFKILFLFCYFFSVVVS